MYFRFINTKEEDFNINIISVGNLNVGGSGKTPFVSALASKYQNVCIVLRGYGRESKGLKVVKTRDEIVCDVKISGDEAMIYARQLPNAIVIVSEDRKLGILKAKEMGSKIVFLDDAYSKHSIKKLDILIDINSSNNSCLPAGPFRERLWRGKKALIVKEGVDFKRKVSLKSATKRMSLVTAIARPSRLEQYLPKLVNKHHFEDHYSFNKSELEEIIKQDKLDSLLVTYKDYVKIDSFGINLSLLDLEVKIDKSIFKIIDDYIAQQR